jgi:hypothetical protein
LNNALVPIPSEDPDVLPEIVENTLIDPPDS